MIRPTAAEKAAAERRFIENAAARRVERQANREALRAEALAERKALAVRLATENLDADAMEAPGVADAVFAHAWSEGHGFGDENVESVYVEIASIVNLTWNAGVNFSAS